MGEYEGCEIFIESLLEKERERIKVLQNVKEDWDRQAEDLANGTPQSNNKSDRQ